MIHASHLNFFFCFSLFPMFDLCTVASTDTPLQQKISDNVELREAFVNHYTDIFEQYVQWKNYSLGGATL